MDVEDEPQATAPAHVEGVAEPEDPVVVLEHEACPRPLGEQLQRGEEAVGAGRHATGRPADMQDHHRLVVETIASSSAACTSRSATAASRTRSLSEFSTVY